MKKCRSPADDFLLHACRETDRYLDRRTYVYLHVDKRYSPFISTICGPNNLLQTPYQAISKVDDTVKVKVNNNGTVNEKVNEEWIARVRCTGPIMLQKQYPSDVQLAERQASLCLLDSLPETPQTITATIVFEMFKSSPQLPPHYTERRQSPFPFSRPPP